jgi:molecular chaperone DnaK
MVLAPLEGELEGTLATHYGKEKPVIIHMTPFSLGVGLQSDSFAAIIERNSTYPTEAKDIFTTTRDFQETISFPIYEGEELKASENTFLDLLRIEGVTPAPRGVPRVEVTFRLNPDRILEVRGEDLATGLEKKITISATAQRLSDNEKMRMIKEARERVARELREKIKHNVNDEARDVIDRAQALIGSMNDHPRSGDLKGKVHDLQSKLDTGGDASEVEEMIFDLMRVVNELESAAM